MPIRVCTGSPTCPNPAVYRGRCHQHARTNQRNTNQNRQAQRRVYLSKRWAITRDRQLHNHPLCEQCGHIATDVHHIQDLADGGEPYAFSNLQSLCHPCHSRHTARS